MQVTGKLVSQEGDVFKALYQIDGVEFEQVLPENRWSSPVEGELTAWSFNESYYKLFLEFGNTVVKHDGTPVETEIVRFSDSPSSQINWSDGMASRSRHSKLILYARNRAWDFTGSSIEGVCVIVGTPAYNKNGKWSSTSYTIVLADGIKSSSITQSWDSGRYVDNHTTVQGMAKDLGLEGLSMKGVERFVKAHLHNTWLRHEEHNAKMEALEVAAEEAGAEIITYEYCRSCSAKRVGDNMLLVDGEVFKGVDTNNVKVISKIHHSGYRGGSTEYKLEILSTCLVEELPEHSPYDPSDDSLESRGYVQGDNGWERPSVSTKKEELSEFALLLKSKI